MRQGLTAAFKAALMPSEMDEVVIQLLQISHSAFGTIYVCDSNADFVSNGLTYTCWGFELALNDEIEGQVPSPTLVIDNTEQTIILAIRKATGSREKIVVQYKMVIASDPNTVQIGPINYKVGEITGDVNTLQASLILAILTNESVPFHSACPANWPGLFGLVQQ